MMEWISIILALLSALFAAFTYVQTAHHEKKKATIEDFNRLQNEVLDKFVCVEVENAEFTVENMDQCDVKKSYDDQRALIARLEHFSVGVKEKIYNFKVVDKLAGRHLIELYEKIEPIIDEANKDAEKQENYSNFKWLVEKLKHKNFK